MKEERGNVKQMAEHLRNSREFPQEQQSHQQDFISEGGAADEEREFKEYKTD